MLNRLVLANCAFEHYPLVGVLHRSSQRSLAEADRLGRNQDALGVQAVEDVLESLALLADAIFDRNAQIIDENLIRVYALPSHFLDLSHLDTLSIEIGIKERQATGSLGLLDWRRTGEQQDLVRYLRRGDPHFLP